MGSAMNLSLLRVLTVTVALRNVEGSSECNQALEEAVACQERAMATHESEAVEPTIELGRKWLNIEAKRNCRFITSLNTCGDELVAVCPDMFEFWTNMGVDILNKFQETNEDWDTEKCPGAMALKGKKESSQIKQTSLYA